MEHRRSLTGKVFKSKRAPKPKWMCYDLPIGIRAKIDRVREQSPNPVGVSSARTNIELQSGQEKKLIRTTKVHQPRNKSNFRRLSDSGFCDDSTIECEVSMDKMKYIAGTMIQPCEEIFKSGIIDDLVVYFVHLKLLSDVRRPTNYFGGPLVSDLIKRLMVMFANSKHNMANLTACLVSVFQEIALHMPADVADDRKSRLLLTDFVTVVSEYVRELDGAMWSQWFAEDAVALDWFRFMATVLIPDGNYFAAEDERRVIGNAIRYLERILYHQYSCAFNDDKPVKKPTADRARAWKIKFKKSHQPELPKKLNNAVKTRPEERSS